MATLVSPGVSISVTDESFYAPAGAGTVPLIVIATAQDKTAPDGTSTAAYTTAANANKVYLITSQRDLLQNYGNPSFKSVGGTPVHGDETNEYGLMAAYSFMGVSNRAYVLRADIDLDQLENSATAPSSKPAAGTLWLDTANTVWGLKKYNGTTSKWVSVSTEVKVTGASDVYANSVPKAAFGKDGQVAAVYVDNAGETLPSALAYEKISGVWYVIGSASWLSAKPGNEFFVSKHTAIPSQQSDASVLEDGDYFLQTSAPNSGSTVVIKEYNGSQYITKDAPVYETSAEAYDYYEAAGTLESGSNYVLTGPTGVLVSKSWNGEATLTVASSAAVSDTAVSNAHVDAVNDAFKIYVNNSSTAISVYLTSETNGNCSVDDIVTDIQSALSSANVTTTFADQITASNVSGKVTLVNTDGRDIRLAAGTSTFTLSLISLTATASSNWEDADITASATEVVGSTADGTLWYDADISTNNLDLLEHDGHSWVTYSGDFQTSATEPTTNSAGGSLSSGDLWIDSSDTENVAIYKYDSGDWVAVDLTDQSSPDGILFADFRQSSASSLDADAPDASLYPAGMIGWNYRASGGNVKQWNIDYTSGGTAIGNVWVSYSGNKVDGAGLLLRKAQRRAVVKALQAAIVSNQDIRNEVNRFNLVAVPGYPECTDEMLGLSVDKKDTVFCIVDTPLRLDSSATSVQNWATNANNASENGEDGLLSASSQAAVYYPSGLTTNLDGTNVMVPASHMALRTYAYNDQVAFPWFAPAGFQRGLVNNATSVGYLDAGESEFVAVSLNNGQRDTLYLNKVNPIATFPGRGISIFGQKTLSPVASAMDRVNVSRLVIYLREILDDAVKPFLFEPNDVITRTNAKVVVDRLLSELVTQRGLYDYVTVCDESNNTPARIDRNELHIDIAIQPVKAVEFIYIPIRIQNTLA